MRIQVLVAAMNQTDHSLVSKMNIQTDAIVGNQCDYNLIEEFQENGNRIRYLNFAERGVGLNRNNTLMRADGDICLFADDDMVYEDNYAEIIERAFLNNPEADVIVFNLKEKIITRKVITKKGKVGYLNFLRYGTARIAVRLSSVRENGIYFNQCFGGGTEHCHGEDNLFLNDCLNKGLKVIAVPEYIATLTEERTSSWNNGYDKKYLMDQGILYKALSKRWWRMLCLQDAIRHSKRDYHLPWWRVYSVMVEGE